MRTLITAAVLLAASAAPAQADDLSTFLRGRWGYVNPDWSQPALPRGLSHTCEIFPGTPDTALTFSGPLGAIVVTSNHRIASPGPLSSPLTVGKLVRYDAATHSEHLASAQLIVEVEFMRRLAGGGTATTKGLLGIAGPDRFVIVQTGTPRPAQMFLGRCTR